MRTLSSIEIGKVQGAGPNDSDIRETAARASRTYDLPGRATLTTTLERNHSTTFELDAYDHKFRANSGEELVKFTARAGASALFGAFTGPIGGLAAGQLASYGIGRLMDRQNQDVP